MHTGNGSGDGVLSVVAHHVSASTSVGDDNTVVIDALDSLE